MEDSNHFLGFFQGIGRMLACWKWAVAFPADSLDGRRIFQGPPILGPLYGQFPILFP